MLDILSNGRARDRVGKGNFSIERDRYGLTLERRRSTLHRSSIS